jgi:DNA repair photolyase
MINSETTQKAQKIKGRGALENTAGRFERYSTAVELEALEAARHNEDWQDEKQIRTEILRDTSRTIISTNDSPDVGMGTTLNAYRGCEHGCIYCYARPTHEYFGFSAGQDFETKILIKPNAAQLLKEKFQSKSWQPKMIFMSGVTDCYQPLERTMKLTRGCLEVMAAFRNPVSIVTKNHLVTRDVDLLCELAAHQAVAVNISLTTLDSKLARVMEPRTSQPARRLAAIETLAKAGIPVNAMLGPVLPGLTEHEIPAILKSAADAGAYSAYYNVLRLPHSVKDLFQSWLREHYPNRADKILNRIRSMRDGKLNDSNFGTRMHGKGVYADQIEQIFKHYRARYNLVRRTPLSTAAFKRDAMLDQLSLNLD